MRCVHYSPRNEIWIELKFALWRGKHSRYLASFGVFGNLNVIYCRLKPTLSDVGKEKPQRLAWVESNSGSERSLERTCTINSLCHMITVLEAVFSQVSLSQSKNLQQPIKKTNGESINSRTNYMQLGVGRKRRIRLRLVIEWKRGPSLEPKDANQFMNFVLDTNGNSSVPDDWWLQQKCI